MTAKISHLELHEGDGLFIRHHGSVEQSVFVEVHGDELWISGPQNWNTRTMVVEVEGATISKDPREASEANKPK